MHTDTSSFYHRARKGALKHDLAHLLAGSELMFHSVTRARAANISSEDGKGTSIGAGKHSLWGTGNSALENCYCIFYFRLA